VLCPDDVPRGFPWPDLVLTALLRFGGGDVREMAVASGTEHGLVAGRRAGAQIVAGVLTGPHTPARMRRAGATHLIESIAELPELVATAG
jgi:phosphoglycolate phosphatase